MRDLDLHHFPPLTELRATLVGREDQRLPALPTTALHGALARALYADVCIYPERPTCENCPRLLDCPYPALFEPVAPTEAGEGVTDRAPPALVMAPERTGFPAPFLALRRGERLRFTLTLIGERARACRTLLVAALRGACREGLGVRAQPSQRGERPRLYLERVETREVSPAAGGAPLARLVLRTPLRLKERGRISGHVTSALLWRSLLRRADILCRLYGSGPLAASDDGMPVPSFKVTAERVEVVPVRRYSSRQGRSMVWPGLMGVLDVAGPGVVQAWPLLAFCERVHVGKATSFGFGRYVLKPVTKA
jgi:hypothetical protein